MLGRYGRLPSMQALLCFEAAARLRSFSRAAEELSITQSAISHQVRGLEEQLGAQLFRRLGRTIEPTDAGLDLLETARRTLGSLSAGINRLEYYIKEGSVVISCLPAWGRHWLLPRLPSLRERHPHIDPWVVSTYMDVDFVHTESDCFIAYGDGHWPGFECVELYRELLTPLCTPALAKTLGRKPRADRLLAAGLLHDEGWEGWGSWFQLAGLDEGAPVLGTSFSDHGLMLDAALAGQGLALGSLTLAQHALGIGALVQPFAETLETGLGWYLVGEAQRLARPEARAVWQWLVEQVDA